MEKRYLVAVFLIVLGFILINSNQQGQVVRVVKSSPQQLTAAPPASVQVTPAQILPVYPPSHVFYIANPINVNFNELAEIIYDGSIISKTVIDTGCINCFYGMDVDIDPVTKAIHLVYLKLVSPGPSGGNGTLTLFYKRLGSQPFSVTIPLPGYVNTNPQSVSVSYKGPSIAIGTSTGIYFTKFNSATNSWNPWFFVAPPNLALQNFPVELEVKNNGDAFITYYTALYLIPDSLEVASFTPYIASSIIINTVETVPSISGTSHFGEFSTDIDNVNVLHISYVTTSNKLKYANSNTYNPVIILNGVFMNFVKLTQFLSPIIIYSIGGPSNTVNLEGLVYFTSGINPLPVVQTAYYGNQFAFDIGYTMGVSYLMPIPSAQQITLALLQGGVWNKVQLQNVGFLHDIGLVIE
ncbi:MAG: hypothetical protein AABY07_11320 [Nanoarchaeota archaeon]